MTEKKEQEESTISCKNCGKRFVVYSDNGVPRTEICQECTRKELQKFDKYMDVKLTFEYLHKGCWSYTADYEGKILTVSGGEASHEAAYCLELQGTIKFSNIVSCRDDWVLDENDKEINVSEKDRW